MKGNDIMEFKDEFDVILGKARDITDAGIKKADEVVRVSKLKLACVRLDSEIKNKYTNLGKMVYGMVKHDSADSEKIAEAVMEIERLYKKMSKLYAEIETTKKIVTCPVCGTKNKFENTYCSSCSHKLVATDEEPEDYGYNPEFEENE